MAAAMNESFTMNDPRSEAGKDIRPSAKWVASVLATTAFSLSLWLTIQKLTGKIDTLAGCGAGSGCANVLGSKWSMVFGTIPVSVFSCLLYLAVLASLWLRVGEVMRWRELVRWLRILAAWILVVAAAWFVALQLIILKTICPYCMVMHGLGIALGGVILVAEVRADGGEDSPSRGFSKALMLAVVLVLALALIQHFGPGPDTHRVDRLTDDRPVENVPVKMTIHSAGEGRLVTLMNGVKSYRVEPLPHIGPPDAEHVLVKYFDYTCEGCRAAHDHLERVMAQYPGKLAVIVLPVPLERACNPHLPKGVKDHQNACQLARLSLRVWRADPAGFAEFHQWLFEFHDQPYEAAEAMAYSLVSPEKLDEVDPAWVEDVLRENVADYKVFLADTPVMPKILLKDSIIQGATKDAETLEALLKSHLDLGK